MNVLPVLIDVYIYIMIEEVWSCTFDLTQDAMHVDELIKKD